MEIIDQLLGGDLPLPVIGRLLGTKARQALYHYVRNVVVVFANKETLLPTRQSLELLRDATTLERHDEIRVSLTEHGARAFEDGTL